MVPWLWATAYAVDDSTRAIVDGTIIVAVDVALVHDEDNDNNTRFALDLLNFDPDSVVPNLSLTDDLTL